MSRRTLLCGGRASALSGLLALAPGCSDPVQIFHSDESAPDGLEEQTACGAATVTILGPGTDSRHSPAIVVNAKAVAHAIWLGLDGRIYYRTGKKGNLMPAEQIPSPAGTDYHPHLAVAGGVPHVVFTLQSTGDPNSYSVYYTRREAGVWRAPQKLSNEAYAQVPRIAVGSGGTLHVVYQSSPAATPGKIYYSKFDGMSFSPPVSPSGWDGLRPEIAVDGMGLPHVVWNAPASPFGISYTHRGTDGSWGAIKSLASGHGEQIPTLAIDGMGRVHVAYYRGDDNTLSYVSILGDVIESTIANVQGTGFVVSHWPRLAVDGAGRVRIAYQARKTTTTPFVVYQVVKEGATFAPPRRLTDAVGTDQEQVPDISAAGDGVFAAVYWNSTQKDIRATVDSPSCVRPDLGTGRLDMAAPAVLTWAETAAPPPSLTPGGRPGFAVGPCFFALHQGDSNVYVAKETAPGQLGSWNTTTPLPGGPTYDTWTASAGNYAYVGPLTPGCFSCYHTALIDTGSCTIRSGWSKAGASDGSTRTGVWMAGTRASVMGKTYVYALGGYFAGLKTDGLYAAFEAGSGALGPWHAIPDITRPAMSGTAFSVGSNLYLLGGGTDTDPYIGATTPSLLMASLSAAGAPGSFVTPGTPGNLPYSARGVLVAVTGRYVYAIGGVAGGGSTHVQRAVRAAISGGSLGAWQDISAMMRTLPSGYGVGFLPAAQIGNVLYAFAGGDTRTGTPPAPKVFAVTLE